MGRLNVTRQGWLQKAFTNKLELTMVRPIVWLLNVLLSELYYLLPTL
jgi:hypothetical protein